MSALCPRRAHPSSTTHTWLLGFACPALIARAAHCLHAVRAALCSNDFFNRSLFTFDDTGYAVYVDHVMPVQFVSSVTGHHAP